MELTLPLRFLNPSFKVRIEQPSQAVDEHANSWPSSHHNIADDNPTVELDRHFAAKQQDAIQGNLEDTRRQRGESMVRTI